MSDIKRFFKHSSIYAFGNVLNRIGAFLLLPLYTTYLTVVEYGTLEMFYLVSSVVSGILAIGLAHATLRFYFEYEKQSDRNAVVSTNLIASFIISLIGVSIALIFDDAIVALASNTVNKNMLTGLYVVLATLVLELSSQVCLAYLRARELSIFYVVLSAVKLIIQVCINAYMVIVAEAGITGILIGNFAAVAASWLLLIIYTLYHCGIKFHYDKMKHVLLYSYPFLFATLIELITVNADRFMLKEFMGLAAVGVYALALKLTLLLDVLVAEPFSKSYGSYRFSIMNNPDSADIQKSITRYMSVLVSIILIAIVYSSHEIITIMSSPDYYTAVVILPVLIFAGGIKVFNYIFQTGILYKKATKHMITISVIACISVVILNYLLIKSYGLIGACIAKVAVSFIVLIVTNNISQKYMRINYPYFTLIKVVLITILFIIFGVAANELDFWQAILTKFLLFTLFIVVLYNLGALNDSDKSKAKIFIYSKLSFLRVKNEH